MPSCRRCGEENADTARFCQSCGGQLSPGQQRETRKHVTVLKAEPRPRWGIELAIRTGVNTGEILVAGPAPGQSLALGNAMNIGARLQQAAAAGEILLSESTWRLAHHAVPTEPIQPLLV